MVWVMVKVIIRQADLLQHLPLTFLFTTSPHILSLTPIDCPPSAHEMLDFQFYNKKPASMYLQSVTPKQILHRINFSFTSPHHSQLMCIVSNKYTHRLLGSLCLDNEIIHSTCVEKERIEDICVKVYKMEGYEEIEAYEFDGKNVREEDIVERMDFNWKVRKQNRQGLMFMFEFVFTPEADYGDFPPSTRKKTSKQPREADNSHQVRNNAEIQKIIRSNYLGKKYYREIVQSAFEQYTREKKLIQQLERQRQRQRQQRQRDRLRQSKYHSSFRKLSKAPIGSYKGQTESTRHSHKILEPSKKKFHTSNNAKTTINLANECTGKVAKRKKRITIEEEIDVRKLGILKSNNETETNICNREKEKQTKRLRWNNQLEQSAITSPSHLYSELKTNIKINQQNYQKSPTKSEVKTKIRTKLHKILNKKSKQQNKSARSSSKIINLTLTLNKSMGIGQQCISAPYYSRFQQYQERKISKFLRESQSLLNSSRNQHDCTIGALKFEGVKKIGPSSGRSYYKITKKVKQKILANKQNQSSYCKN